MLLAIAVSSLLLAVGSPKAELNLELSGRLRRADIFFTALFAGELVAKARLQPSTGAN